MKSVLLAAGFALCCAASVHAHDYKLGALVIDHPWARPASEGAKTSAAYLSIKNNGSETDTLVSAASPLAAKTQLHQTSNDGGVMKMREVDGGVAVAPGATVAFKPGSYHIMLLGLKQKLDDGQHIPLTLTFAKAGSIDVEAYVEKTPGGEHEHSALHDHDMQGMH